MKGVYCLVMSLNSDRKLKVGSKFMDFKKGFYCYVGSAMTNLQKRILRHVSKTKKKRWHIDYLTAYTRIFYIGVIPTEDKIECVLSHSVSLLSDGEVNGFGCSDCKCQSHLYFFRKDPSKIRRFRLIFTDLYRIEQPSQEA